MKEGIPLRVKASAAAANGSSWRGTLAVSGMRRLAAALTTPEAGLQVVLAARRGAGGVSLVSGEIAGELQLECQTCLRAFGWPLQIKVELRLVASEEEERELLHECEPYRVEGDSLLLHELVEDEVLLALPIAPKCAICNTPPSGSA